MTNGINPKKLLLANILHLTGLEWVLFAHQRWRFGGSFIRAVNYHSTPPEASASLEEQFHFYQRNYSPVSLEDLKQFLNTGRWLKSKPGLIISFDDGVHNNYSVAAPLLAKYRFVGWFFICPEFCNTATSKQVAFASEHQIYKANPLRDGRLSLSWEEVKKLAQHHVIGNHTRSHCRFWPTVSREQMVAEIMGGKRMLEEQLGCGIDVFCWVGGESGTYNEEAMRLVKETGHRFAFTTIPLLLGSKTYPLLLGKTNIEAHWPIRIVKFQLSGAMDLLYLRKRKQVYGKLKRGLLGSSSHPRFYCDRSVKALRI
jgi:peptidoglycan/xylan/chitin deacetylase (PgdA/CDA1 family)